jgi:hypothetical protein
VKELLSSQGSKYLGYNLKTVTNVIAFWSKKGEFLVVVCFFRFSF